MKTFLVVIETPRGKGLKYDYDPISGYFKLKKVMPAGLVFPFDFGFIPGTMGGDGDPLDVVVISELETFTGCAVECRIIGALTAEQTERDGKKMRNDRFIAIPTVSVQYAEIKKIAELPKGVMTELENFFKNYNQQAGKHFEPLSRISAARATSLIEKSKIDDFKRKLIRLFLPLKDENGRPFPKEKYRSLTDQLTEKYGGITVYTRSPATGLWENGDKQVKDEMLVYDVLMEAVDEKYWNSLKQELRASFKQDEILILAADIVRM